MIVILKLSLEFKLELMDPTALEILFARINLERLSKFVLILDEFVESFFRKDLYTLVAGAFEAFSSVVEADPR
jgi:hypothetical protein